MLDILFDEDAVRDYCSCTPNKSHVLTSHHHCYTAKIAFQIGKTECKFPDVKGISRNVIETHGDQHDLKKK